jgi:hypothetical protein
MKNILMILLMVGGILHAHQLPKSKNRARRALDKKLHAAQYQIAQYEIQKQICSMA